MSPECIPLYFAAAVCAADVAANSVDDNSSTTITAIIAILALLGVIVVLGLVYFFVRLRLRRER